MRIIPAIDLKDGKCVRLLKGDFDKTTEYSADPAMIGRRFSALAVQDLHIVDLDGARSGVQQNRDIVKTIAEQSGLEIQLGGGIRSRANVESWLGVGVTRCVVGSAAIKDPETVRQWLGEFGKDAIVLALDIRFGADRVPYLTTHGWTEDSGVSLWDCIDGYGDVDGLHVLCTDVAHDGTMSGPNVELYRKILTRYPSLQLQASGGVRSVSDLEQLQTLGVPAAITGRALLDGQISEAEIASFQANA